MKRDNLYFVVVLAILIGAMFIANLNKADITGNAAIYSKGRGCYIGGCWDDGYRIQLDKYDTAVRTGQWALVKGTGLLDKIVDKFELSTPQVRAWVGLTAWANEKIYENTWACVRDSSSDELFVGIKYRKEASWWPGWDVIYLDGYCHENKGGKWMQLGRKPTELGYVYLNRATGEIKT